MTWLTAHLLRTRSFFYSKAVAIFRMNVGLGSNGSVLLAVEDDKVSTAGRPGQDLLARGGNCLLQAPHSLRKEVDLVHLLTCA